MPGISLDVEFDDAVPLLLQSHRTQSHQIRQQVGQQRTGTPGPSGIFFQGGRWRQRLACSFATAPCPLQPNPARQRLRPRRLQSGMFASISSAAAAAASGPRALVEGPGQALRLHAEELR